MPVIQLQTTINAPIERCFDVARSIDVHQAAASRTKERAIDGVTSGLIGLGETVTWEAVHFGIKQRHTSRITKYRRPHFFVDQMVRGTFRSFVHVHLFRSTVTGTLMIDKLTYTSPLGLLGWVADKLFLKGYMKRFLQERAS